MHQGLARLGASATQVLQAKIEHVLLCGAGRPTLPVPASKRLAKASGQTNVSALESNILATRQRELYPTACPCLSKL